MADLQFSSVKTLEIALHDQGRKTVLFREMLLLVAFPAAAYHVEMIDGGIPAGLGLDIVRRSVAARAYRPVRGLLGDDVLPVHALFVHFIDVAMALGARCLCDGV